MRRAPNIAAVVAVIVVAAGFVALATGAGQGQSTGHTYWVEMDNAFGLVQGGDLKIAGVIAGKITKIQLDEQTNRALIGFTISSTDSARCAPTCTASRARSR